MILFCITFNNMIKKYQYFSKVHLQFSFYTCSIAPRLPTRLNSPQDIQIRT